MPSWARSREALDAPSATPESHQNKEETVTLRLALVAALLLLGVGFSAAPAFAQDNYGAIALSDNTGNSGAAWDYPNRFSAERSAIESCGTRDCQVVIWFSNS